jgi:hypothetical protein
MPARPKTYKKKETDGQKLVKLAKERYKRARDAQSEENSKFKSNMKFCFQPGAQWPEGLKKQRESDMRPCIEVNQMPVFGRAITNDYKRNSSGVKVIPAADGDEKVAEIFTGLIRNIETQSSASQIKGNALVNAVSGCKGFYRVVTKYMDGGFEQEIRIEPIVNTTSVTYDCDDTSLDGSGWQWAFIEDQITEDEFKKKYPDEVIDSWPSLESDGWCQNNEGGKKIRICEYFYIEKEKVTLCKIATGETVYEDDLQEGMEVLDTREAEMPVVKWCVLGGNANEPLESNEWAGKYIPIVPVWGEQLWIDNKRVLYSALEYSHDAQRMLNFFRSTEVELLGLQNKAPYVLTPTQIEGFENQWKGANSTNSPYLLANSDPAGFPIQRQPFPTPPSGVLTGAANSAQDMRDTSGIQQASLGMQSNETSGRAINARAAQGEKATFHILDNMAHADVFCGRILVDLIPRIYDTPRVERIMGYDGSSEMKELNQETVEKDEYGMDVKKIYDLTVGTYDVIVSSAPNFQSLRQEGQQMLTQLLQGNPQLMQQAGDIFIKSMDIPYAGEVAERLAKFLPEGIAPAKEEDQEMPPQIQQQIQGMQQQMQQMDQMIQQQAAELASKQADYALKEQEIQIKQFDAETKRIQAMQRESLPVQADVTINPDDLSEADKLEISIAQALHMKQLEQEHDIKKTLLAHKLSKMVSPEDGDINENGEVTISPLVAGLQQNQEAIQQMSQAIANLTAINAAPKRVIRNDNGEIVGTEPVL